MTWVRVDDAFYDHRKFNEAGPLGLAQYMAALAYCNRNLTDGFISFSSARRLLDWEGISWNQVDCGVFATDDEADGFNISMHLVNCELFELVEGGFRIHDYHDYQPTAEEVNKDRGLLSEKRREAGRKGGVTTQQNRRSDEANKQTAKQSSSKRPSKSEAPTPHPNPNPLKSKQNPPSLSVVEPDRVTKPEDLEDPLLRRWIELLGGSVGRWRSQSEKHLAELLKVLDPKYVDLCLGRLLERKSRIGQSTYILLAIKGMARDEHVVDNWPREAS